MRITPQDRQEITTRGLPKLIEICEIEQLKLTEKLKKASDINIVRYTQGQLEILDSILTTKAS